MRNCLITQISSSNKKSIEDSTETGLKRLMEHLEKYLDERDAGTEGVECLSEKEVYRRLQVCKLCEKFRGWTCAHFCRGCTRSMEPILAWMIVQMKPGNSDYPNCPKWFGKDLFEYTTPFCTFEGKDLHLDKLYQDAGLFLVLSGPSLAGQDLNMFNHRGLLTMGVNNSPSLFKPNLWTCVDKPDSFHDGIWLDPTIIKFAPYNNRDRFLNRKTNGLFSQLQNDKGFKYRVRNVSGIIYYRRNAEYDPTIWLTQNTVNWGNSVEYAKLSGGPHVRSVMLAALKIAFSIGIKRIYLLGCDFKMEAEQPYSFGEKKIAGGVRGNNDSYRKLTAMLCQIRKIIEPTRLRIYNCNPTSNLTVFPFMPLEKAIEKELQMILPEPWDMLNWYGERPKEIIAND